MKNFLIYPLCLMPIGAYAATTFYYDTTGICDGLFLNPNATLCSQAVTRVTTPTRASKSFVGYYAGNTKVIDSNGNILIDRTAVPSLTNSADSDTARATAGFAGQGQILVKKHTFWPDNNSGWYNCSGVTFQLCDMRGNFAAPHAPDCWSNGSWPLNTGYDYIFNSWRMADDSYMAASSNASWSNPYPDGVATGDSSNPTGCSEKLLGPLETENVGTEIVTVSDMKIYPFACKLLPGSLPNTWSTTHSVTGGKIVLDNSTAGTCTYNLQCDEGYTVSGGGQTTCTDTGCKTTHTSLDGIQSKLGTCERDTTKLSIIYTVTLEESTKDGQPFSTDPTCSETDTCTVGQPVTLKNSLTCKDGETVSISKWTNGSKELNPGTSVTCSISDLGTATDSTITLTGTIGGN